MQAIHLKCSQAAEDRNALVAHLDLLAGSLCGDSTDTSRTVIENMRILLASQQSALVEAISGIPDRLKTSARSGELAERVFAIPELSEMILSSLDNRTLLFGTYGASRLFLGVIEGSRKLRRRLGLDAEPTEDFRVPISDGYPWFPRPLHTEVCRTMNAKHQHTTWISFRLSATVTMGSRCRTTLVCQPPVQKLMFYTQCCRMATSFAGLLSREGEKSFEFLAAKPGFVGVTIGDVFDTMKQLQTEHRLCPNATTVYEHNDDGTVEVKVVLVAKFESETGAHVRARLMKLKALEKPSRFDKWYKEMVSYLKAKSKSYGLGTCVVR